MDYSQMTRKQRAIYDSYTDYQKEIFNTYNDLLEASPANPKKWLRSNSDLGHGVNSYLLTCYQNGNECFDLDLEGYLYR